MHRFDHHGFRFAAALGAVAVAGAAQTAFAGDVTVSRSGSKVLITGTGADDTISLLAGEGAGELLVVGDAMGTTVNGGQQTVVGVTGKDTIVVDTGDGRNQVSVLGALPTFKTLLGIGGTGDDRWDIATATLPGAAQFTDPGGSNLWVVTNSRFAKTFVIAGGAGTDSLFAYRNQFVGAAKVSFADGDGNGASLIECVASAAMTVLGGVSADQVSVVDGSYAKSVLLSGGEGADTIQVRSSSMDAGSSATGTLFSSGVRILGGGGDDQIEVTGMAQVRGPLTLQAGAGTDNVRLVSLELTKGGTVDLGSGNDSLLFNQAAQSGKLKVLGGSGDDSIRTDATLQVLARATIFFDGGSGSDTLVGSSQITLAPNAKRVRIGFEI